MPFTENFAGFFNAAEFGVYAATYTPQGGGQSVDLAGGVFDADYKDPLGLVQSEGITFLYSLAKTPAVKEGDSFTIQPRSSDVAKAYVATIVEKDFGGGVGLVLVHLQEQ